MSPTNSWTLQNEQQNTEAMTTYIQDAHHVHQLLPYTPSLKKVLSLLHHSIHPFGGK